MNQVNQNHYTYSDADCFWIHSEMEVVTDLYIHIETDRFVYANFNVHL